VVRTIVNDQDLCCMNVFFAEHGVCGVLEKRPLRRPANSTQMCIIPQDSDKTGDRLCATALKGDG
ncbi:MAG: hypothetical protein ACI9ZF_001238, partial [Bradyrhizobium sp.]